MVNNWKRFGDGKWEKGDYEIWVYKGKVDGRVKWIVRFKEIGGGSHTKSFQTKSQAMKEAIGYMRKN